MKAKTRIKNRFFYLASLAGFVVALPSCGFSSIASIEVQDSETTEISTLLSQNEEGKQRFLASFSDLTKSGVTLDIEKGSLTLKGKEAGSDNLIDFSSSSLSFALSRPSLHGLSLALDAPLTYNGVERYLGAYLNEDCLYFAVDLDTKKPIKYKVDIASYTGEYDPELNGYAHYEYGRLTWLIENILDIINDEDSPALSDNNVASKKLDWNLMLDCLASIKEYRVNDLPYFEFHLQLVENGPVYPIGLRSTSSYSWAGIDFPSKISDDDSFSIQEGIDISFEASIASTSIPESTWIAPGDKDSYLRLDDSFNIFKIAASYVKEQAFNIDADLTITHHEEAVEGTETTFGREEIAEGLHVQGSVGVSLSNGALDQIGGEATLDYLKADKVDGEYQFVKNGQSNHLALEVSGAETGDNRDIYVALNGLAKAKTNKETLDGLIGKFNEFTANNDIGELPTESDNSTFAGLLASIDGIANEIKQLQESVLFQGIQSNQYHCILEAIDCVETSDNIIQISLALDKLGFSGKMELEFSGIVDSSLLSISFFDAKLGLFTLNGTASVSSFELHHLEGKEDFPELTHVPTIADELGMIVSSKQAALDFEGYILQEGTTVTSSYIDNTYNRHEEGLEISGEFALDLEQQCGSGSAKFVQRTADYAIAHTAKIDVSGPHIEGSEDTSDNQMFFEYSSQGAANKPLKGRLSLGSLGEIISTVSGLLGNNDPRFERLTNLLGSSTGTSIIDKLSKGYLFDILTSPLISSLSITSELTTIVLPKDLLGLKDDLTLKLHFEDSHFHQDGNEGVDMQKALRSIEVTTKFGIDPISELYLKLNINEVDIDESDASNPLCRNFGPNPDKSSFTDYSSISTLLDYVLGTIQLGVREGNSLTTYHISGKIALKLLGITIGNVPLEAYISLNGAEVNVYGHITVPKYKGLFVDLISEKTHTEFYYHTDGKDPVGTVLFRRYRDSSKFDQKKVTGADLTANLLDWILKYAMGAGKTLLDAINKEDTSSSAKPINGEDAITSFSYSGTKDAPKWTIGLDLQELTGANVSMDFKPTIGGVTLAGGSDTKHSIYSITGSMNIIGVLINLTPDLKMANIVNENGGYYYHDCWSESGHNAAKYYTTAGKEIASTSEAIYSSFFYQDGDYIQDVKDLPFSVNP